MTSLERRQPSQNLINGIDTCLLDGKSLKDKMNEVLALGKAEGFTELEMGDIIRQRSRALGLSSSTIRGYLPAAAKHIEKVRVRQLAPDSISKTIFAPDSGAVDYKNLPEQTEPEPAETWEQRVSRVEAKFGIDKDVDDSLLYPSAAKDEQQHTEQLEQLQIDNAQLTKQVKELNQKVQQLTEENELLHKTNKMLLSRLDDTIKKAEAAAA